MYCKKCGIEIDNDSIYCKHCGAQVDVLNNSNIVVNDQLKVNSKDEVEEDNKGTETNTKTGLYLILALITILTFSVFMIMPIAGTDSSLIQTVFEREVTTNDYVVNTTQGITSYSVSITPNTNIKTLEIEFLVLNNKHDVIYRNTSSKSNMSKDKTYTFTFEYGFVNALSASNVEIKIKGKTAVFKT